MDLDTALTELELVRKNSGDLATAVDVVLDARMQSHTASWDVTRQSLGEMLKHAIEYLNARQRSPLNPEFWESLRALATSTAELPVNRYTIGFFSTLDKFFCVAFHPDYDSWRRREYPEDRLLMLVSPCLDQLEDAVKPPALNLIPLEPITKLIEQGVNIRQICSIYNLTEDEYRREVAEPGSVTSSPDWMDPRELNRQQQEIDNPFIRPSLPGMDAAASYLSNLQSKKRKVAGIKPPVDVVGDQYALPMDPEAAAAAAARKVAAANLAAEHAG